MNFRPNYETFEILPGVQNIKPGMKLASKNKFTKITMLNRSPAHRGRSVSPTTVARAHGRTQSTRPQITTSSHSKRGLSANAVPFTVPVSSSASLSTDYQLYSSKELQQDTNSHHQEANSYSLKGYDASFSSRSHHQRSHTQYYGHHHSRTKATCRSQNPIRTVPTLNVSAPAFNASAFAWPIRA